MKPGDNQFRPQHIDEQVEWLVQRAQEEVSQDNYDVQIVQHLQHHYESEKQKETLRRAWQSIAQRYEAGVSWSPEEEYAQDQHRIYGQTKKILPMGRVLPHWSTLLAVAVLVLVIGSTAVIMSRMAASQNAGPGGGHPICVQLSPITPERSPAILKPTTTVAPCAPTPLPTVGPLPPGTTPTVPPLLPGTTPTVPPLLPGTTPTVSPLLPGTTPTVSPN